MPRVARAKGKSHGPETTQGTPVPVAAPHDHAPRRRTTSRWASAVVLVAGLAVGGGHAAYADNDPTPSESDVAAAKDRADAKGRDVAAVQADLIRANLALETAGDDAAQAAEAWNGARWRAEQARADADAAEDAAEAAREDVESQRELYADTVVQSYEDGPQVQGLSAIVEADGIESLIDRTVTMGNTSDALNHQYDSFLPPRPSPTSPRRPPPRPPSGPRPPRRRPRRRTPPPGRRGHRRRRGAVGLRHQGRPDRRARRARGDQRPPGREAAVRARAGGRRGGSRRSPGAGRGRGPGPGRGRRRRPRRTAEAQAQAEQEQQSTPTPAPTPTPTPTTTPHPRTPRRRRRPDADADRDAHAPTPRRPRRRRDADPDPTDATPTPTPTPTPPPTTPPTPPTAAGVDRCRGRDRLRRRADRRPVQVGRLGPERLGLLGPHRGRVGRGRQVAAALLGRAVHPVDEDHRRQLAPGDLVFWGSSSNPSSIYHVALYIGDGQIIHAPRTGPAGEPGVDVLLAGAELLRPPLTGVGSARGSADLARQPRSQLAGVELARRG